MKRYSACANNECPRGWHRTGTPRESRSECALRPRVTSGQRGRGWGGRGAEAGSPLSPAVRVSSREEQVLTCRSRSSFPRSPSLVIPYLSVGYTETITASFFLSLSRGARRFGGTSRMRRPPICPQKRKRCLAQSKRSVYVYRFNERDVYKIKVGKKMYCCKWRPSVSRTAWLMPSPRCLNLN